MATLLRPSDPYPVVGCVNDEYYECAMCGPKYEYYEIRYDGCSVAPTVGETITGASSGCTGVVVDNVLETGAYATGNAAGTMMLSGTTGAADDLAFTDNEALSGSTSFVGTANTRAIRKQYGLLYPSGDSYERDGKRYCGFHYRLRFTKKDDDAMKTDVEED